MVLQIEVAQVEAQGWKASSVADWRGIYLEVYVEKAKKRKIKCKCCCRSKNRNKQQKSRTGIEDEASSMRWRVLNKEGFLQALFYLEYDKKRRRKGDQLIINADVMVVSEMGQANSGEKVASYKGTMQVGTWGPVVLYDSENKEPGGDDEETTFTLETRPISARPFKLENAKPWDDKDSLAMIMRAARYGRRNSVTGAGTSRRFQQSPAQKGTQKHKMKEDEDRGTSKKSRKSTWSVGSLLRKHENDEGSEEDGDETSKGKAHAGLASASPGDSAWTIDIRPLTRLDRNYSLSGTNLGEGVDEVDVGIQSTVSRNSTQFRSFLDKFFENSESETLQEPAKRQQRHWLLQRVHTSSSFSMVPLEECNREWKPTDWQIMWHAGKVHGKDNQAHKSDGYDVVPLMEAEFRRDCVVFYNTLFPNVDGSNFQMLRDQSLSEDGPLRFRKAGAHFDLGRRMEGRKSDFQPVDTGWDMMKKVMSRVSARPMGKMLDWRSVASSPSRTDRRSSNQTSMQIEDDLEIDQSPGGSSLPQASGVASVTSRTNSNYMGPAAPQSESDALSSGGFRDDDLLYCLKLDMLDNMDEARYVVMPPRAPATGRRMSKCSEEDFSVPQEQHVSLEGQNPTTSHESRRDSWLQPVDAHDAEESDEERGSVEGRDTFRPGRPRLPRRNSNTSVDSTPYAVARANVTPLIARLKSGQVFSSVEHGLFGEEILDQGAEFFVDNYSPRIMFLKRLLVCYALCGVYYSEAGNAEQLGDPWPYPIASVLGHGSRVLIRLEDVDSSEFLNYLLTGDPHIVDWKDHKPPMPIQRRIAATHSVELTETGTIVEKKLRVTNVADAVRCINGNHMGLNLPIGGVGNPSPLGPNCLVSFHGEVLSRKHAMSSVPSLLSRFALPWRKSEDTTAISGPISEASEISGSSKVSREDWKVERRVQSGHLYIRTDDFGDVSSARSSIMATKESNDPRSRFKMDKELAHVRMAKARQQAELRSDMLAGDLCFPAGVPQLNTRKSRSATRRMLGQVSLLRVNSEPDLRSSVSEGATAEDIVWVGQALVARQNMPLVTPPSATALKMLIEHYDPVNANLYGTGGFKSVDKFRKELASGESLLARSHKGGLQRFCQPVILQLRFRGCVLMKMGESREGSDEVLSKPAFAVISAGLTEHWRSAVMRILSNELCIRTHLTEALTPAAKRDEDCLTVLTETTMSPSYPGMPSVYRTHMVSWEVEPHRGDALRENGLIFPDPESSPASSSPGSALPFNSHFTTKSRNGSGKKIFWRWVPFFEAQKLQRFVNLGEATADERWAKYAFQKEGVVQFPPTETALMILLRRCGIDVEKYGTERYRPLRDFWLDLTAKESLLYMSGGKPLRLADSTVVRLKWRPPGERGYQVLVKEIKNSNGKQKLLTRRMLQGETWEESALHCIEEDLSMKPRTGKQLLAQRSFDAKSYTFLEEHTESDRYPGIKCLYRTHLVSYIIKDELGNLLTDRRHGLTSEPTLLQGLLPTTLPPSGAITTETPPSAMLSPELASQRAEPSSVTSLTSPVAKQRLSLKLLPNFVWRPESNLQGVKGGDLWEQAKKQQEIHHVCSVLLGLEGTAPQMKSPFGVEHDGSGASAPISALGNCKWKLYRQNNALQVPADHGGLRMNITRKMFDELRRTCEKMDLLHPSIDLTLEPKAPRSRELLEHRFTERELFKRILSSNAADAKAVVEWMDDHRSVNKTFSTKVQAVVGTSQKLPEVLRPVRQDAAELVEYSS